MRMSSAAEVSDASRWCLDLCASPRCTNWSAYEVSVPALVPVLTLWKISKEEWNVKWRTMIEMLLLLEFLKMGPLKLLASHLSNGFTVQNLSVFVPVGDLYTFNHAVCITSNVWLRISVLIRGLWTWVYWKRDYHQLVPKRFSFCEHAFSHGTCDFGPTKWNTCPTCSEHIRGGVGLFLIFICTVDAKLILESLNSLSSDCTCK